MRALPVTLFVAAAFTGGLLLSPALQNVLPLAHAQSVPLTAGVYDLLATRFEDLPATANPDMRSRPIVQTDSGTVGVQAGNAPKHIHPKTDEIQYIIEGSGQMWIGDERRDIKPGSLIVIPKGTAHSGTIVTSGPIKAVFIKLPPQGKDDTVMVK